MTQHQLKLSKENRKLLELSNRLMYKLVNYIPLSIPTRVEAVKVEADNTGPMQLKTTIHPRPIYEK